MKSLFILLTVSIGCVASSMPYTGNNPVYHLVCPGIFEDEPLIIKTNRCYTSYRSGITYFDGGKTNKYCICHKVR
jgi:hypothetical protein